MGRIRADNEFADFPIELGAEFIHDKNHLLYDLAKEYESQGLIKIKSVNELDKLIWVYEKNKLLNYD